MDELSVVALIAAYNEADLIGEVLEHLHAEGVSVYLIDNHSTDGTVAAAEPFLGRGLIGIERFPESPSEQFHWRALLQRKQELARELEARWFIHSDADEFRESPWLGSTLKEALERVDRAGYNAVDFALFNFWPTHDDGPLEEGVPKALRYCESATAEWTWRQIKCWKNEGIAIDLVSSGGHDVEFEGRRVFPIRFPLRHYPIRSNEHGRRKVFRERKERFDPEERQLKWHIHYDGFEEGCDFVRDAATLTRYRREDVCLELQVRNRLVEEREAQLKQLEAEASPGEARLSPAAIIELGRAVREEVRQAQRADLERQRREVTRVREEAELQHRRVRELFLRTLESERLRMDQIVKQLSAAHETVLRETERRHAGELAERERAQAELAERAAHAEERLEHELRRHRAETESAAAALERAETESAHLHDQLAGLRDELSRAHGEEARRRSEQTQADAELGHLRGELDRAQDEVSSLRSELAQANDELAHLTRDLNDIFMSKSWRLSALGRSAWKLVGRS